MDAAGLLLASYDAALGHDWESLRHALQGLEPEMAQWQPPAYRGEPHDEGFGRPGTLLWFLHHLEYYHRHYAAVLRARPVERQPETLLPGELPLVDVLHRLHQANDELRAEIARLNSADLDQPCTKSATVAQFALAAVRHIAWHSGQMMTVRRLYLQRE